ncbi:MAG: DUF3261 domain-containing protein [Proteobacteria bacterium]|nr:DUF3261 domain-containing protein [Pseudomonadota bacterium]
MRLIFLLPFVVLLVAACATPTKETSDLSAWTLPDDPREVIQILNGQYQDQAFQFQVRLSLAEEQMQLVGLDALGRRAFKIVWNKEGISTLKADWVSEKVKAEDILNVIVAVFWPEENPVRQRVVEHIGELDVSYQSSREMAWNETVDVRDPVHGYNMTITSYELAE